MSILTNRKELKQIRKLIVFTVLCLCFVNVVYAQVGRCQYKDTDISWDWLHEQFIKNPALTNEQLLALKPTQLLLNSTKQPINGVVCDYHNNGNVEVETPYNNGVTEGIVRLYYESGKLRGEAPYKDGKQEGIEKIYDESGKLVREIPYKDDKKEGIEIFYNPIIDNPLIKITGKPLLIHETPYKDGKKEGIGKGYFITSGKLQDEVSYKNDKLDGYTYRYTESGQLLMKILYSNGSIVSGTCGNGRALTNAELLNWSNGLGHPVSCAAQ